MRNALYGRYAIWVHQFRCRALQLKSLPLRALSSALVLILNYLSVVICKVMIDEKSKIGEGLWISPKGKIIIGADILGNGCVIHHNVTIGMSLDKRHKFVAPKIGNNVWIGPNTSIYGNITIGEGATILENTVVSRTLPPGIVVQGNPIQVLKKKFDNSKLRSTPRSDYGF
jgi:serine acetyltransferase